MARSPGLLPKVCSTKLQSQSFTNFRLSYVRVALRGRPLRKFKRPGLQERGGPGGPPLQDSLALRPNYKHRQRRSK